jgi:hypothetical protein
MTFCTRFRHLDIVWRWFHSSEWPPLVNLAFPIHELIGPGYQHLLIPSSLSNYDEAVVKLRDHHLIRSTFFWLALNYVMLWPIYKKFFPCAIHTLSSSLCGPSLVNDLSQLTVLKGCFVSTTTYLCCENWTIFDFLFVQPNYLLLFLTYFIVLFR